MNRYRQDPEAIRALVRPDAVHRDVYLSQELFDLEMERLWRDTWIYVGHDSQVPSPGDYYTTEIARQPIILLRDEQGVVRVLMNRCAHKGARLVSATSGHCENNLLRCPYHGWTYRLDGSIRTIPLKGAYEGTALADTANGRGVASPPAVVNYRGFVFTRMNPKGPGFEEYFGASLTSIDNLVDRSPEGRLEVAGGVLRYMHDSNWKMFVENLNDTMHPMVAHESSAGTAKKLWADKPEGDAQAHGHRAVPAVRQRLQASSTRWACASTTTATAIPASTTRSTPTMPRWVSTRRRWKRRYGDRARARHPRRGAAQHRLLPEPDDQGRDPGDPRGAADRGRHAR